MLMVAYAHRLRLDHGLVNCVAWPSPLFCVCYTLQLSPMSHVQPNGERKGWTHKLKCKATLVLHMHLTCTKHSVLWLSYMCGRAGWLYCINHTASGWSPFSNFHGRSQLWRRGRTLKHNKGSTGADWNTQQSHWHSSIHKSLGTAEHTCGDTCAATQKHKLHL